MFNLDQQMPAFYDELVKTAIPASLVRGVGGLGTGIGAGAAVGALGGAAIQGYRGYREGRQAGYSPMDSALSKGLGGAIHGALKGGLVGAAAGGVGLGALEASGKVPGLASRIGKLKDPIGIGGGARFGQRQIHGLTGWTPQGFLNPAGARELGLGAHEAREGLESAAKLHSETQAGGNTLGFFNRLRGGTAQEMQGRAVAGTGKVLARAEKYLPAAEKAESMGLTSLPGYFKSMKDNGVLNTVGAGLKEQWHAGGPINKSLMFGLPAASVVHEGFKSNEPGGPGKLQRMGRQMSGFGLAMGPMPLAGQVAMSGGMGTVGSFGGKMLGKLRKPEAPASIESGGGDAQPEERLTKDRSEVEGMF